MSKPSNRYRAWQEGGPNDTKNGGPWFVTVPDGGDIEIGYDANGKPDEFHAQLFADAGNAELAKARLLDLVKSAPQVRTSQQAEMLPNGDAAGCGAGAAVGTAPSSAETSRGKP